MYLAAQKLARYQISLVHSWEEEPSLMLMTESKSIENWIRPNAHSIGGFAFLYRFGPYDKDIVGLSREQLRKEIIVPMMRYLVTTHITRSQPTSDGKKWGDHWQSAHWTYALAKGGWWMWDDLPTDLQTGLRRVVVHEAERIAATLPPHRIKLDTKAEENAWNSQILNIAVILMPDDPRRRTWEKAFQKWVMSSFLRPADEHSREMVDGRPVAEQFTGANIHDDYTLENHHFVHPDYMTTWSLTLQAAPDYVMTDRKLPEAMLHNTDGIYENLKWFCLPDGGFVYPSGQDWRVFRNADWLLPNALMATFAQDPEAWALFHQSLETITKMQARSNSGEVYLPEEYTFASTHADSILHLATTWLCLHSVFELLAGRAHLQVG